jgi:uncharacterized membrane protein YphA (DoxX/SURF4 family)
MSHFANDLTVLAARLALAYVYLYAAYLNAKWANRDWLLSHTALLFPTGTSSFLVGAAAFIGVAMMFAGGFLVLVGLATWVGCALLIVFTLLGYWQHCKEVQFATETADALSAQVDLLFAGANNGKVIGGQLLNLRISAYSGQFSSGLKNWGLIGAFMLLGSIGAGAISLDSYLKNFRPSRLIDLIVWPM